MCNIPDFLKNRTEEDKKRADEWWEYTRKVSGEYKLMFPDSTPYLGVSDNTPIKDFYQMMEECIHKGQPMEELHPDYTINWDDYDEGDFID
ncbi:MAG: hypothetical protein K2P41_08730 [Lachnospiraceae bacterium]|nr:hypothetical protein [Lachnospiraceae bacterium]